MCLGKDIELFINLFEVNNFLETLVQTDIFPSRSKHLSSQSSSIVKYVESYFTLDEIQNEVNLHINMSFSIEEINGLKASRARHIRIEIKLSVGCDKLLQKGELAISGHIINTLYYHAR